MTLFAEQEQGVQGAASETIARAFGAENRARLLTRYFDAAEAVTTATAWQHVYRLLLWIDRTTALAHCYEFGQGPAWPRLVCPVAGVSLLDFGGA